MNTEALLNSVRTSEKSNQLLLAPSYKKGEFDSHAVDAPFPFYHDGTYWMTYIGWDGVGYQTGVASSDDLLHWQKGNEVFVDIGSADSIDSIHAHKPGIIPKDGRLYHFYCAVAPAGNGRLGEIEHDEVRGIALATS